MLIINEENHAKPFIKSQVGPEFINVKMESFRLQNSVAHNTL